MVSSNSSSKERLPHVDFEADKRHHQYVMCPQQDCESLVYYSDQNRSMIDVLGLGQHLFFLGR